MRIVQTDRLSDEVFLEPLVRFGLERRRVFEHARHIASLIEEAFAVYLRRDGEFEIIAVDSDGAFTLVAVRRKSPQMDDIFVREQFAAVQPIEKFIVVRKDRFDTGRMEQLQSGGTVKFGSIDSDITISP